ncbi:MAG: hypothetical protein SGILL_003452, partial [Bacillariaceae sp.]
MLARWLTRGSIGNIVAPDDNAPAAEEEAKASLWQLVAPDPNFAPKPPPPPGSFPPSMMMDSSANGGSATNQPMVCCVHCNQWTPVTVSQQQQQQPSVMFQTPSPRYSNINNNNSNYTGNSGMSSAGMMSPLQNNDLERRVLSTAKETEAVTKRPKKEQDAMSKVLKFCANEQALTEKVKKRLRKMCTADPQLLRGRARTLGISCPNGNTPLMACASSNRMDAAEILMQVATKLVTEGVLTQEQADEIHLDVNYAGQRAYHIASNAGHTDMVEYLRPLYQEAAARHRASNPLQSPPPGPPQDLNGRTPLALAMTSPNPKARSNRKELQDMLFSPIDPSIMGNPKPLSERMQFCLDDRLALAYGTADMPGRRIDMEDAILTTSWQQQQDNGRAQSYALLGVCDGHGDNGCVSDFVATHIPIVLRENMESMATADDNDDNTVEYWSAIWQRTCLQVDEKLKATGLEGGSTGVFCLVTKDLVVCANIGDSRCVLLQSAASSVSAALPKLQQQEQQEQQQSSGEASEAPALKEETTTETTPLVDGASSSGDGVDEATDQLVAMNITATATKEEVVASGDDATVVTPLSFDHKPEDPEETERVEKAQMTVENGKIIKHVMDKSGKFIRNEKDQLAVARAFGDFEYKQNSLVGPEEQAVCCIADIQVHKRDPERDMYLVLACDGVWD